MRHYVWVRQHKLKVRAGKALPITQGYPNIPYLKDLKSKTEKYDKESKLAKAYEVALDTRKFEIELYWKRATYFWAIAAVVLGAIGLVVANSLKDGRLTTYPILFMLETLACVGFIVTKAWQYVNRGGKFWQHNWELHVDVLEQEVLFPMFRTVMAECPPDTKVKPVEDAKVQGGAPAQPEQAGENQIATEPQEDKSQVEAKSAQGGSKMKVAVMIKRFFKSSKEPDGLTVVFSPSKVNDFLGSFLNRIFVIIGALTFLLILWKAGVSSYFADKLGIYDVRAALMGAKIWLIPFAAALPLLYTLYFWIKMAGNARTTTLKQHLLNVTQRDIYVNERIDLPGMKERGYSEGIKQVITEIKPEWLGKKPVKTTNATKTPETSGTSTATIPGTNLP